MSRDHALRKASGRATPKHDIDRSTGYSTAAESSVRDGPARRNGRDETKGDSMDRKPVASSFVLAIGYDPLNQVLEVEFIGGALYQYDYVPEMIFQELMNTPSKGRFLNTCIRNRYRSFKIKNFKPTQLDVAVHFSQSHWM